MITEGLTIMTTDMSITLQPRDLASALPRWCFALASVTAVIGVSLGIYMGLAHDFTLAPVHAHINLLGWVSLFIMGLYYKAHAQALGRAAILQVAMSALGYMAMTVGMAGIFLGHDGFFPLGLAGALMVWTGFAMFAVIVVFTRDASQPRG
jgi:hypothetical protein